MKENLKIFRILFEKLKKLYDIIWLWYWEKKFFKEVDSEINYLFNDGSLFKYNNNHVFFDQSQYKYQEGLIILKREIAKLVKERTSKEYDRVLRSIDNLISLAQSESSEQRRLRQLRERIIVFRGKDIKNEKDKQEMINRRINDYYQLREHKEKRELLRTIRKLEQCKDFELANKLKEQFYERFIRPNTKRS